MENVVKYFDTVESSFRKLKMVVWGALGMAALVAVVAIVYSMSFVSSHQDNIYVLDKTGAALSATAMDGALVDRRVEAEDHVRQFHNLMFNLFPNREAIEANINAACEMCDKSAYEYYLAQQERQFYTNLISQNISQYINIDSVKVNTGSYPYRETTYGRITVMRESNMTSYRFVSEGQLVTTGRSKVNPHGFMLEQFRVVSQDVIETRRRK